MSLFIVLFTIYIAFSVVATVFYIYHVGFSKDDLFVLTMDRIEQKEFLLRFMVLFGLVFYLLYSQVLL